MVLPIVWFAASAALSGIGSSSKRKKAKAARNMRIRQANQAKSLAIGAANVKRQQLHDAEGTALSIQSLRERDKFTSLARAQSSQDVGLGIAQVAGLDTTRAAQVAAQSAGANVANRSITQSYDMQQSNVDNVENRTILNANNSIDNAEASVESSSEFAQGLAMNAIGSYLNSQGGR